MRSSLRILWLAFVCAAVWPAPCSSASDAQRRGGYENLTPAEEAAVRARQDKLRADMARMQAEMEQRRERTAARAAAEGDAGTAARGAAR